MPCSPMLAPLTVEATAMSKVEEHLQQVLDANDSNDELIDVVLRFVMPKTGMTASKTPVNERRAQLTQAMSRTIEAALARASEYTGEQPAQVTLFPALGSVVVQAHRPYVRALLDQGEVSGAMLNSEESKR